MKGREELKATGTTDNSEEKTYTEHKEPFKELRSSSTEKREDIFIYTIGRTRNKKRIKDIRDNNTLGAQERTKNGYRKVESYSAKAELSWNLPV
jgi:hypothetical protein